jgi:predicted Zn finger-like uncharacterized protein
MPTTLEVSCPACQARAKVLAEHIGRKVRCNKCSTAFQVPGTKHEPDLVDFLPGPVAAKPPVERGAMLKANPERPPADDVLWIAGTPPLPPKIPLGLVVEPDRLLLVRGPISTQTAIVLSVLNAIFCFPIAIPLLLVMLLTRRQPREHWAAFKSRDLRAVRKNRVLRVIPISKRLRVTYRDKTGKFVIKGEGRTVRIHVDSSDRAEAEKAADLLDRKGVLE